MLFENEIFEPIVLRKKYQIEIKQVRKDGKMALRLVQKNEVEHLEFYKGHGEKIKLIKESPSEEIVRVCHMSKKLLEGFKSSCLKN